ncbi:beta-lactamase-like protein [Phycomyces nitens]|nr:beta-lactamase-like protein [Phycomyces nitens]
MVNYMDITFLGTGSAQPSATRNHQAMALRLNGDIWMFDCGEATQHQMQKSKLKMGRITRIFITHMHGDHCFGLAPLLCSMTENLNSGLPRANDPPIEIYGPRPLRHWLRTSLKSTYSHLGRPYRVHELLLDSDTADTSTDYHDSELPGENLRLIQDTQNPNKAPHYVMNCTEDNVAYTVLGVPIKHSIPSLGFLVQEPEFPGQLDIKTLTPILQRNSEALRAQGYKNPLAILGQLQRTLKPVTLPDGAILMPPVARPGRQIVILGDTSDASPIITLCRPNPHLLVHEATNALTSLDRVGLKIGAQPPTQQEVEEKALSHGHSTPQMAGKLAHQMGVKKMILTHFSVRYKGDESLESLEIMEEIRSLAVKEFGERKNDVYCARDLWSFEIKYD